MNQLRSALRHPLTAWCVLLLAPALVHLPALAASLTANPLYFVSGLVYGGPSQIMEGLPGFNDPNTGFTTQALGALAARLVLHGVMPWWNSFSGVGLPLAAEMQSSALFLPFTLLLNAHDGVIILKYAMEVLAGFATFALLRQLAVGEGVALLGGVLFSLNGTFAVMGDAPIMPIPFLPLLLLGIERTRAHAAAAKAGGWAWIAVAVAYSLYAGFPETAFIDGLLAATWTLFRGAAMPMAAMPAYIRKIALGGGAGLLLAMPVVVPFLEVLPLSYTGVHGVAKFGLDPANYAMFLIPYLLGPIDYGNQWIVWGSPAAMSCWRWFFWHFSVLPGAGGSSDCASCCAAGWSWRSPNRRICRA